VLCLTNDLCTISLSPEDAWKTILGSNRASGGGILEERVPRPEGATFVHNRPGSSITLNFTGLSELSPVLQQPNPSSILSNCQRLRVVCFPVSA